MLRIFCDLADSRSFSKTAEKHLLSQSAVSQQLAQLELAHKCQLVTRKRRPIELTAAGQLFYTAAKDILERYDLLKSELNTLKTTTETRINIAAIFSIGMHSLPDYVKKFMVSYPNVNVHIEYLSADVIYEQILDGEIDIGIVAVPKKDRRLDVYDFEEEPLLLACSPRHPLAKETQVDIHKLQFERFIAFEKAVPTRLWIDAILARYSTVVRPVMEFDNIETIKRAVEINGGVSILPEPTIVQEVASGTIKAVPFSNERFVRPTGIIVRKDRVLSQAARYCIELLRKQGK
ncbi:MAG: LysR family transcriptional regulator [Sedimentisphaerales bacterium]|jgi:DNA-binding transcriptional LysR family regulator|nr:LysR family transcriptional regulator [Sedimentisphaerales bacterium]HNY79580.1 LysR family transcriptional regulator [Sedimentisphaerales bacterium]HOC65479.1 LysR family transcriptional regulator [Sedimentisphaerales bacterium]HOH65577.1 LysR family transcriptional regulator [Sedimentisphaerales bacterium]HPY49505.1 LysR family transcriptional regulator [Sedimentisphaerales bacterium]